jgi:MYXO-CTERM domain-containing protein
MGGNTCPTELVCTSPDTTIGDCIVDTGTGGAGGGTGGTGGTAASGGSGGGVSAAPDESGDDGGCACTTAGSKGWGGALAAGLFAFGAVALVRRRRR